MTKQLYHPNQEFICPQCGMRAVIREEEIVEGLFEVVGKRHICSLCGWQIPEEQMVLSNQISSDNRFPTDDSALDALFGDDTRSDHGPVLADETVRFCKNCHHYLKSPFLSRCLLNNRDVDPLGICEQFRLPDHE